MELGINSMSRDDASNYSCTAVNDVGRSQRTAVLTVNCKFYQLMEFLVIQPDVLIILILCCRHFVYLK